MILVISLAQVAKKLQYTLTITHSSVVSLYCPFLQCSVFKRQGTGADLNNFHLRLCTQGVFVSAVSDFFCHKLAIDAFQNSTVMISVLWLSYSPLQTVELILHQSKMYNHWYFSAKYKSYNASFLLYLCYYGMYKQNHSPRVTIHYIYLSVVVFFQYDKKIIVIKNQYNKPL